MKTVEKKKTATVPAKHVLAEQKCDCPLTVVHRFIIAAMVCLTVWNGYCAFNWLRTDKFFATGRRFPSILPFLPDAGPFIGIVTLGVTMFAAISLYGLITLKKNAWLYSVLSLCLSSGVKNLICIPVWFTEQYGGTKAGIMCVIETVLCLISVATLWYYAYRSDNFEKEWTKELGHHLTIGAMFVLMIWCGYCAIWWLGTEKVVFSSTWHVEYPTTLPRLGHRGWILGIVAAVMVIYCIATISGLSRYKKASNYLAILAFPLVAVLQIVGYWYEYIAARIYGSVNVMCNEVPFLVVTALIFAVGILVCTYYKSRKDRFCNSW